ncbi:MAG: DinB family protein [Victivallaceae bacterium]
MDTLKILNRGHQNLTDALKDLPDQACVQGFVTGSWTVKDVVDHVEIYEALQLEAFQKFLNPSALTPLLDQKAKGTFLEFNNEQWQKDKDKTWPQILKRYMDAFIELQQIIEKISPELLAKPGTSQWYGEPCSLDDIIALSYGHKKHHIAQIKLFRQRI